MTPLVQDTPATTRQGAAAAAFRNLLVHVRDDPAGTVRLHSAVALAERLGATLTGLGAEGVDPMVYSDGYGLSGGWIGQMQAAIAADVGRAEALFRACASPVSQRWQAVEAEPLASLVALARSADLIVAGPAGTDDRSPYRACDTGELVLKSGRPVLVVPQHGGELHAQAVVLAWKDTRESRRAMADALPFLQDAEQVLVLEICSAEEAADAEARTASVAQALRRHGVTAQSSVRHAGTEGVADGLVRAADAFGADLIVAGGYGRTRLGEWAFGGVTRTLLRLPRHFALLSH